MFKQLIFKMAYELDVESATKIGTELLYAYDTWSAQGKNPSEFPGLLQLSAIRDALWAQGHLETRLDPPAPIA